MKPAKQQRLTVEKLEPRCLLSGFYQGVDVDGDLVTVELFGRGDLFVETVASGEGDAIEAITVDGARGSTRLVVLAQESELGDGLVDAAVVDAADQSLRQIFVDGYVGDLFARSVRRIEVEGVDAFGDEVSQWAIDRNVGLLSALDNVGNVDISIGRNLRSAFVDGDIFNATLSVDRVLRSLVVYNDVEEDSLIFAGRNIGWVSIEGQLSQSVIDTPGRLRELYVQLDVLDSTVRADRFIHTIIVDGNVSNSGLESNGMVRFVDVWELIEDSDIIAGPQGIVAIWAEDLINTNIDTVGPVRNIFLDG